MEAEKPRYYPCWPGLNHLLRLSYMLLKKRMKFVTAIVGTISLSAMLVIFAKKSRFAFHFGKAEFFIQNVLFIIV